MNLFELLESKQKYRRPFSSGEEFRYFIERRHLLGVFKRFAELYDSEENEFDIFRANIFLQGLENKELFEAEIININNHGKMDHARFVETLKERTIDKPYYEIDGIKIYIPFLSSAINDIYVNEPEKLLTRRLSPLSFLPPRAAWRIRLQLFYPYPNTSCVENYRRSGKTSAKSKLRSKAVMTSRSRRRIRRRATGSRSSSPAAWSSPCTRYSASSRE